MIKSIYTRWILGGIVLLIIIAGACYLWYQHDTAPYKQAASDAQKLLQQSEIEKSEKSKVAEQAADAPAESSTPTAEKPKNENPAEVENNTEAETQQQSETPAATAEVVDVPVSPYGFGPYPKIPDDYPGKEHIDWSTDTRSIELLRRVLIKLWNEGERNFRGGSTHNGKVYPHYHDTVYVKFSPVRNKDGKIIGQSTHIKSGTQVQFTRADLLNPPPGLRVLDLESSGIDPYQYLNLPLRKGKK